MRRLAAAAVLVLAAAAPAAPPAIDIPPEVRAAGEYVVLTPKTDAKSVVYVARSGVEPFPSAMLRDPRAFVLPVRGLPAGRYQFVAVGSLNDEQAAVPFAVVVGDAPPPVPPGPTPPGPADPLVAAVQAAYAAEADPAKATLKTNLAALYRQGGEAAQSAALATWGQLFDAMATAAQTLGVSGKLPAVQSAVRAELVKALPTDRAAPLDAAGRAKAREVFQRVAAALEAVQ